MTSRGIALLINNYEFKNEVNNFPPVSKESSEELSNELRQNKYEVISEFNLSAENMMQKVESVQKNAKTTHDSVIIAITSHGNEINERQVVYGSDESDVDITEIILMFTSEKCPNLKDKVKIFLIDACRGDGDLISTEKLIKSLNLKLAQLPRVKAMGVPPTESLKNVVIVNATKPGKVSYTGTVNPVLLFAGFALCLRDCPGMELKKFLEAVEKAVENAAAEQIKKKFEVDVRYHNYSAEFSFSKLQALTGEQYNSAVIKVTQKLKSSITFRNSIFYIHFKQLKMNLESM